METIDFKVKVLETIELTASTVNPGRYADISKLLLVATNWNR